MLGITMVTSRLCGGRLGVDREPFTLTLMRCQSFRFAVTAKHASVDCGEGRVDIITCTDNDIDN